MSETSLRQADAKVDVVGIVSENKLEEVIVDGKKVIRGELVLQTGDINFVTFNVYAAEKKKDGTDNGAYAGLKTVMNEYDSVAKVGKENAAKVVVSDKTGQIRPRSYVGKDGQVHTGIRYQSMFFNRYQGNIDDFDPHAWFELELYIESITEEIYTSGENKDDPTGRVVIKGWMPTYEGIEPMVLYAPAGEVAEAVLDECAAGDTAKFFGDIVNSRAEFTEQIPVKIGKPRVKKRTVYKSEMVITGMSEVYSEDGGKAPYDSSAIRQAITERNTRLESEKEQSKKPEPTARTKASKGLPSF